MTRVAEVSVVWAAAVAARAAVISGRPRWLRALMARVRVGERPFRRARLSADVSIAGISGSLSRSALLISISSVRSLIPL